MGILSGIRKAGKAAKKASKAATAAKKDKPKTFESEMKELRGKAMTDARRQAEAIKIAKKYNKNISIEGKTFGPKKKKDTPEKAEAERKAAKERVTRRKNKEAAKVTEKKGSIAKKMTVSKTDIQQANTARELSTMQRRVDAMDDGLVKKSMQKMLNAQRKKFEKMQADEVDTTEMKRIASAKKELGRGLMVAVALISSVHDGISQHTLKSNGGEWENATCDAYYEVKEVLETNGTFEDAGY